MDCTFVVLDARQFGVLIDDRVSNEVQRFESVEILQFCVQLCDFVVCGVDLAQLLQFFDAPQRRQAVAREVDSFQTCQLADVCWDLGKTHAAQIDRALVASLCVPDFELNVTHFFTL